MYIRSFKPAGEIRGGWMLRNFIHVLVFAAAAGLMFIFVVPGLISLFVEGQPFGAFLRQMAVPGAGELAALGALAWLARPAGAIDFDAHNANDVESMGLYWHFVDIVWIVIFTAVYLLEYVFAATPPH